MRSSKTSDRRRGPAVFLVAVAFAGCTVRGTIIPGEPSRLDFAVPAPQGRAYEAARTAGEKLGLAIGPADASRATVRLESSTLTPEQLDRYCVFPAVRPGTNEPANTFQGWAWRARDHYPVAGAVALTVHLTETSSGETNVTLVGNWRATGGIQEQIVSSKGVLERDFETAVEEEFRRDRTRQDRLHQLERLHAEGLVSSAQYERKRGEILREPEIAVDPPAFD